MAEAMARAALGDAIGGSRSLTAEETVHYLYGLFHWRGYREGFAERLKVDYPPVPLPRCEELFNDLSNCGRRLWELHVSGELSRQGFVRQEDVYYDKFLDNRFGAYYASEASTRFSSSHSDDTGITDDE